MVQKCKRHTKGWITWKLEMWVQKQREQPGI